MSPYILPSSRPPIDEAVDHLVEVIRSQNSDGAWMGDAAYAISRLLPGLTLKFGEPRYWHMVALMGIMETVKIELFKRIASPFELERMKHNGDVSEFRQYTDLIYPPTPEEEEPSDPHEG
jgi:hypothetical protein